MGVYFERPEKGKHQLKKRVTAKSVSTTTGPKSTSKTHRKPASKRRPANPGPAVEAQEETVAAA